MNSNQTLTKLIVATVAVIGVTALVWYFGFSGTSAKSEENEEQPKSKTKKLDNESATEKKVAPKKESKVVPQEPAPKKVEVVVEDASDDEEEDEQAEGEVDPEAEELAEIKTKYDDANRLAAKYITGMKYEKAIEKLTEAIELAPRVSNSGKSTVTLYNNRSAMYEKTNTYDKSLSDITVILTLDPFHVKSRLRKARILEAQGKEQQAVDENMICALIQQRMGEAPSAQQKIDEIAKNMALKQAPAIFQKLRAVAQEFPLPSKSHIRNYFESFPSMQAWYDVYRRQDRTAVEIELADAKATDATPSVLLQKTLALVCFDLVNGNFEKGFELLKEARALESSFPAAREAARNTVVDANGLPAFNDAAPLVYLAPATLVVLEGEENVDVDRQLLSLLHLLVGVELHMRCQLDAATASYKLSVLFYANNMDGRLTLFNAYLEQGNLEKCLEIVNDVIAHLEARKATLTEADSEQAEVNDILKSWALLHRITAHVTRNDAGAYSPTAISDAQSDLSTALALAEQYKSTSAVAKAAIVTGLIRSIHILVQNKPMAGGQTTEEDMEECNKNLQYAKSLNPTNPMVLIMEVELLNSMGKGDEALEILETIERKAQAAVASGNTSSEYAAFVDDCTPYIVRASNRVNKAMMLIQTEMGSYDAQQQMTTLLEEADKLYKRALEIEPSAVEVLNQYAQYLSGFRGQFEEAIVLLKKAISVARTKDDVQELQQLLIVNEAQDRAVKFFQSMAPP